MTKSKVKRNDKCPCKSGKKYKLCCQIKDEQQKQDERDMFDYGQPESNEDTKICLEYLAEQYTDHRVIDISNLLSTNNYEKFQQINYSVKIIMVAQKNEINKGVFLTRGDDSCDMMVMYRGSYRAFNLDNLANVTDSIDKMIQTRLSGELDK